MPTKSNRFTEILNDIEICTSNHRSVSGIWDTFTEFVL